MSDQRITIAQNLSNREIVENVAHNVFEAIMRSVVSGASDVYDGNSRVLFAICTERGIMNIYYSEVGNAARSDLFKIAVRVDPNMNGKEPAAAPARG